MTTFRINRVYTRSGDSGDTGLVGGSRVSKGSQQVETYGEIDELNSVLGIVIEEECSLPIAAELRKTLQYLQQELFDLGSELASPAGAEYPDMWKAGAEHVSTLEVLCDKWGEPLSELTSFILPGGSKLAANLQFARTVARRAERALVRFRDELAAEKKTVNPHLIEYLNRLSDLLFVMARRVLHEAGKSSPLWQPERERKLP